jgi:hypothetical protein
MALSSQRPETVGGAAEGRAFGRARSVVAGLGRPGGCERGLVVCFGKESPIPRDAEIPSLC